MHKNAIRLVTAVAAAGLLATVSASAASDGGETPGIRLVQADGLSLQEAVEQVRRKYNGRIVSAETRRSGNREVHVIKVLTPDGKVKTERIPGRSRSG